MDSENKFDAILIELGLRPKECTSMYRMMLPEVDLSSILKVLGAIEVGKRNPYQITRHTKLDDKTVTKVLGVCVRHGILEESRGKNEQEQPIKIFDFTEKGRKYYELLNEAERLTKTDIRT